MGNIDMIVVCSYCRKQIEEKEPYEDKRQSHSICPVCYDYHVPQLLGKNLSQHLDKQDSPAIIMDEDGRVVGVNQAMLSFLGKRKEEVLGLLGGEMMGCRYSRLNESCGKTLHCATCSIRNTMNQSRTSKADLENVVVTLDRDEVRLHFRVSAFHREDFTKLVVHETFNTEPLDPTV